MSSGVLTFLLCLLAGAVSLALGGFSPLLTPAWLINGVALHQLWTRGPRALPMIALAAGLTMMPATLLLGIATAPALLAGLALTAVAVLHPLISWVLYRRLRPVANPFGDSTSYMWLVLSLVVASTAGSLLVMLALAMGLDAANTARASIGHWVACNLGALLPLSLIMAHERVGEFRYLQRRIVEWLLWATLLAVIVALSHVVLPSLLFLLLPMMLWAATRFTLPGGTLAITLATAIALVDLHLRGNSDGPLGNSAMPDFLILMMVGGALFVRAILEELKVAKQTLEAQVEERTRELQLTNYELRDEIYVRKQAERSHRESSRRYRTLVEAISNPIVVVDEHFRIKQWNPAAESLFGYPRDAAVGRNYLHDFVSSEQHDEIAWKITKVLNKGAVSEQLECDVPAADHAPHRILWNINTLDDDDESEGRRQAILVGQDITEIRATQDQLHYLAHFDTLTGTANRRLFEDRCRQAIESARRYGHAMALMTLDVDHFKRINDTLGHDAGDKLLQQISARLAESVRKEDTIARLGGDEFAVLLPHVNGKEGCERVARMILDRLADPILLPGGELVITSSLGITLAPEDGSDYTDLLKNADMAMYRAKKMGRNNYQFYSREMNLEMRRHLSVEQELRVALRNNELSLHFQPCVDLRDGRLVALEALLRWKNRRLGELNPGDFLDIAEQSGLTLTLAEWTLNNALLHWRAVQAMSREPIRFSVNLSEKFFIHPQLVPCVNRVLLDNHADPKHIDFDISEAAIASRLDDASKILPTLRRIGVGLTLDRFGSAMSSIRHLRSFPFERVKIDRSLINDVPTNENTSLVVTSLLQLARSLGIDVMATGIESYKQERFFRERGVILAQGNRYSRPIPGNELPALFAALREGKTLLPGEQFRLPLPGA